MIDHHHCHKYVMAIKARVSSSIRTYLFVIRYLFARDPHEDRRRHVETREFPQILRFSIPFRL